MSIGNTPVVWRACYGILLFAGLLCKPVILRQLPGLERLPSAVAAAMFCQRPQLQLCAAVVQAMTE